MDTKKSGSSSPSDFGVLKDIIVGGLIGGLIVGLAVWLGPLLIDSDLSENRLVQQLAKVEGSLTAWDLFALPVLILIVLATHEIGHLLGGLSQGMRFLLLIVGPFGWHASVSGTRFEWNTNLALMGGIAAAVPTKVGADLRRQLLVLIAGGPAASLLLTVLAVGIASVLRRCRRFFIRNFPSHAYPCALGRIHERWNADHRCLARRQRSR
jgi:hypothetical protein